LHDEASLTKAVQECYISEPSTISRFVTKENNILLVTYMSFIMTVLTLISNRLPVLRKVLYKYQEFRPFEIQIVETSVLELLRRKIQSLEPAPSVPIAARPQEIPMARQNNSPNVGTRIPFKIPMSRQDNSPNVGTSTPLKIPMARQDNSPNVGTSTPFKIPMARQNNSPNVGTPMPGGSFKKRRKTIKRRSTSKKLNIVCSLKFKQELT
jgi:hypothetical protein